MTVCTNGFVLTENKNVFQLMGTIEETLITLVKQYSKDIIFRDTTSKFPRIECRPTTEACSIYFKVNDENRILTVNFGCDCDYSEYGDSKIIWSINCWGLADEIVLSVCEAMKEYGRVFYVANDAEDNAVEV